MNKIMFEEEAWNDVFEKCKDMHSTMFNNGDSEYTAYTAVIVHKCDDSGCYDNMEVHVFKNYLDSVPTINMYEYSPNVSVRVVIFNAEYYVNVKEKLFDSNCYSSMAGCSLMDYRDNSFFGNNCRSLASFARNLYDLNSALYLY